MQLKTMAPPKRPPSTTKKEICALLVTFYAAAEKLEKRKKDEFVAQLRQELESSQGNLFNGPSGTVQ
jgi:hypothetical protein